MVMSWLFTGILLLSIIASAVQNNSGPLASAVTQGAQAGLELAFSLGGSICLWSGVGKLMDSAGLTALLSNVLSPILSKIFPSYTKDREFAGYLSQNICANLLGLGNAATPLWIKAVQRMKLLSGGNRATNEMCRLIVMNTASIQLLPTTVASLRASMGATAPFDILPAVWLTSVCSVTAALLAARLMEGRHG